jgi:hypothetical protein
VKAESLQWRKLRPFLVAAKLDPIRVENPIYPGTPDVNHIYGWIELKQIFDWPRDGLLVRIPHFTPQQRVFLYKRWRAAPGTTFLLLEIRSTRQWLLFDGDVAARIVGRAKEDEYRARARAIFDVSDLARLPKILTEARA